MTSDKLKQWRADVIERAINVEWLISAIICQHYFKQIPKPFFLEVLYDEYFSFALKRRVLEKIVDHPDLKRRLNELNRLNTIRNYFAHCGQQFFPRGSESGYIPDPREPTKSIDFEALYSEFVAIAPRIETFLFEVFKAKGGAYSDKP